MLQIHVSNARERQQFEHPMGPLEFGRGPKRDATPRCVIQDDLYVSKDHVRIEEMAASRIRFETLIAVQRAAAGSPEFYEQTAQAVVDLVGLDRGLVVLRRINNWEPVARAGKTQHSGREFSLTILQQMVQERRTFFQSAASGSIISSLQGIEAVVASPVFDAQDQVVGSVYGSRTRFTDSSKGPGIGPLEAQIVQLLASAVGVGLARLEQEAEAGRLRVHFEQFFSRSLARELQR